MNTTKQIQLMVGLVFLLVAGLLAYTIWEPTRIEDAEERQVDAQLERAAKLFANNCAACHGLQGGGFVGPALNRPENRPDDPQQLKVLQDRFRNTITCGRVGTFMPAWSREQGGSLNGDQIRQLVLLITSEGHGWELVDERVKEINEEARVQWEKTREQALRNNTPPPAPFVPPIQETQPTPDQVNQGACGQVLRADAAPTGTPPPSQATWDVEMGDNVFRPRQLAVPVGQQVTINLRNTGAAIHNLRIAGPDGRYDTPDDTVSQPDSIRAGQTGTVRATFAQAGSLRFRCDFHPTEMTGTLTVQ